MSYEEQNPKHGRWYQGWHLDKRFHIGNILTILVIAVSMAMYVSNTDNKADNAIKMIKIEKEARIKADKQLENRMDRSNKRLERDLSEIKESLVRIEEKLYDRKENN